MQRFTAFHIIRERQPCVACIIKTEPFPEAKLVRCTKRAICDVVVDLRRDSPTFRSWMAAVLTATKRNMVLRAAQSADEAAGQEERVNLNAVTAYVEPKRNATNPHQNNAKDYSSAVHDKSLSQAHDSW